MKQLTLISLLIFVAISIRAQHDFRPGYIITNSNDTIYGEIDLRSNIHNSVTCSFKKDNIVTNYAPFEIYSYRIPKEKYYVSREVEIEGLKKQLFLEYLVEGISNLYYLRNDSEDYYFLEKEGRIVLLDNKELDVVNEEGAHFVKNTERYKGVMKVFFNDAKGLSDKINYVDFDYKPLINITKAYHNAVCDEYDCIDYTKETKTKIAIEPYAGVGLESFSFESSQQKLNSISPYLGVNFIFKPIRAHKVWNFEVGLGVEKSNYTKVLDDYKILPNDSLDAKVAYTGILVPIKVRYELPGGKIQPYISAGLLNKMIVGDNTKIIRHLDTFFKPKEEDVSFRFYNPAFIVGVGFKYNTKSNRYWVFDANYHQLEIIGTNSMMDGTNMKSIFFTLGYGFVK